MFHLRIFAIIFYALPWIHNFYHCFDILKMHCQKCLAIPHPLPHHPQAHLKLTGQERASHISSLPSTTGCFWKAWAHHHKLKVSLHRRHSCAFVLDPGSHKEHVSNILIICIHVHYMYDGMVELCIVNNIQHRLQNQDYRHSPIDLPKQSLYSVSGKTACGDNYCSFLRGLQDELADQTKQLHTESYCPSYCTFRWHTQSATV